MRAIQVLAGLALASAGSSVVGEEPQDRARSARDAPNVVVIQTDDQSFETMRVMSRTRRLIGERGASFSNYITNWPLCCPARATQLTGQYAHNHNVLGNRGSTGGGYKAFAREENLAVWLRDAGYRVGHVGKFLNGYGVEEDRPGTVYDDSAEIPPGWTDWRTIAAGSLFAYRDFTQIEWSIDDGLPRLGERVTYGSRPRDFRTLVNTRDATGLIDAYARAGSPFYLQVDYVAPHTEPGKPNPVPIDCTGYAQAAPGDAGSFADAPFAPARDPSWNEADVTDKPESVQGLNRINSGVRTRLTRAYRCALDSLLAVDRGVAEIVEKLRKTGELANTYVIFTSDNGYLHGQHRVRKGKNEPYEPSVRVPFLMRGPGIPPGTVVRDVVSNADQAPTVLDVTGARAPSGSRLDGLSLLDAIRGEPESRGRDVLIETNSYVALRNKRFKLIRYEDGFLELYDLKRDPFELESVAGEPRYAEREAALGERLEELETCAGQSCH